MSTEPFTVIVDTREPKSTAWRWGRSVPVERRKLDTGDYAVKGLETRFAIERKSLHDWVASCFGHWRIFGAALARLKQLEESVVIVESSEAAILEGRYRFRTEVLGRPHWMRTGKRRLYAEKLDKLPPSDVLKAVRAVRLRYGVRVELAGNRQGAKRLALAMMQRWHAEHSGDVHGVLEAAV